MATIDVKDAAGSTVAIEKPLAPGRAAAASSRPVALSTEDKAVLDTLATQTTAAAILAKLIAAPATEAKQDTGNTSLASIASLLATQAGYLDGIETLIGTTNGKDFATQTTLAAILAKIIAAPATEANQAKPNTVATTNPTSTLTLPASTSSYLAGQLVANSATAGSVVVPSFAIANSAGGAQISRLRLSTNDATSTGWAGVSVQIDLWSAAPTFTNGDRGTYAVATGSANYLGSFSGTFAAIAGDGTYAVLSPTVGNAVQIKLASGTSVFWTKQTLTGTGTTGASKVFTVTPEVIN